MPELISFPEDVGDGALEGFKDDSQRARDFAEAGDGLQAPIDVPGNMVGGPQAPLTHEQDQAQFQNDMMGVNHQGGQQHDLIPRGFTSDDTLNQAQEYEQLQWNDVEQVPVSNYDPAQPQDQNFQQMYGQSENEKGEWRRRAEAAELREQQLQMQIQAQPQMQPPNFYGPPASPNGIQNNQQAPPVQNAYVPQQPQQYDLSAVKFVDKDNDDVVLASEFNDAIRNQVAPYVIEAYNRAAAAENQAKQASSQLFESHKVQMGITPQVEQQALAQQPWIGTITDPQAYLGALQNFKAQLDRATMAERQTPNPVPQAQQPQVVQQRQNPQGQRILRRATFIEGQGQRSAGEAGQPAQSAQAQWEAAWAATMGLPFEQRAEKQRVLLSQRNVNSVSGYRSPMVLTR